MRQRTLSNRANLTLLENEAELITNLITDSTMETEPSPAVYLGRGEVGESGIAIKEVGGTSIH